MRVTGIRLGGTVEDDDSETGDPGTNSNPHELPSAPLVLTGDVFFAPRFYPERVNVSKERNLEQSEGVCKGQDVTDNGSQNRVIHVTGRLRGESELDAMDELLDAGTPFTMTSTTWSGEVYVRDGEYEGPIGWFPPSGELDWEYRLNLVSAGTDVGEDSGNGIIESGAEVEWPDDEIFGVANDDLRT